MEPVNLDYTDNIFGINENLFFLTILFLLLIIFKLCLNTISSYKDSKHENEVDIEFEIFDRNIHRKDLFDKWNNLTYKQQRKIFSIYKKRNKQKLRSYLIKLELTKDDLPLQF